MWVVVWAYLIIVGIAQMISAADLHGQVTAPITSSGLNTQVSAPINLPNGQTQYNITGGTRPGNGPNLFHSFGDFGVPKNNIGNFLNDSGLATSNILGRVTGGNPSNIFGTLQTTGFGNANLFLMNPAGIVFGPTASLNVGGAVSFTTADYLRLGNQVGGNAGTFYANPTVSSVLTSAPVVAFGFLTATPAPISIQGATLSVPQSQSISLVGGLVSIQAGTVDNGPSQSSKLSAAGGQINMASVASPGEILYPGFQVSPNINGKSFTSLGGVTLSQGTTLDVSADGAGSVIIRGGQLVLAGAKVLSNTVNADGASPAIDISAPQISLSNASSLSTGSTGRGNAGDISILSDVLTISGGARINSSTSGAGHGGNISITASESLSISGDLPLPSNASGIFSSTQGTGDAGGITAIAPVLTINNRGRISSSSEATATGRGGDIAIQGNAFSLNGGSAITSATQGAGSAGTIRIKADSNISLNDSTISSTSSSFDDPAGNGGLIWLTAPNITLTNGRLNALTLSSGNAGNVLIETNHLMLQQNAEGAQSQINTSTEGSGNAGAITVRGLSGPGSRAELVSLSGASEISSGTNAGAGGAGGDISIGTMTLLLTGSSQISTSSTFALGNAGNTTIDASDTLHLSYGSFLQSTSDQSEGNAGQIRITTPSMIVDTGAFITTSTNGLGNAGSIVVNANSVRLSSGAQLTSSSLVGDPDAPPTGAAGTVIVQGFQGTGSSANSVIIEGAKSGIFTTTNGSGAGGDIVIQGASTTLQDYGTLSAATSGTAPSAAGGTITIHANSLQVNSRGLITSDSTGMGNAGNVMITAGTTTLASGGQIRTNTSDAGMGGELSLTATGSLSLAGSGTRVSSASTGSGHGGAIMIRAGTLTLNDASEITAASTGTGNAGTVNIQTSGNFVSSGGTLSSSAAQGVGGSITLNAGQQVQLANGALISASSAGAGNAGDIVVAAGNAILLSNSTISTAAANASGGNIILNAPQMIQLVNSQVTSSVQGGPNTVGGNITIDPQFLILQNGQIIARAFEGQGGNINITAGVLLADSNSLVDASSQKGINGSVTIQSPISNLSQIVAPLQKSYLQATGLLLERCAVRAQSGTLSSLTVKSRDIAPVAPGGMLPGPLLSLSPLPVGNSELRSTTRESLLSTPASPVISGEFLRSLALERAELLAGCGS